MHKIEELEEKIITLTIENQSLRQTVVELSNNYARELANKHYLQALYEATKQADRKEEEHVQSDNENL